MPRQSVEITRESAAHIAKWKIKQILDQKDNGLSMMQKMAMGVALQDGGGVDQIAGILYGSKIHLALDINDPEHKSWLDSGAAVSMEEQSSSK